MSSEQLALALKQHQAGNVRQAEEMYRKILAADPGNADAWHLLGMAAHQAGRHPEAVEAIRQAIALDRNQAAFHNNLGLVYRALGRPEEALRCYDEALRLKPGYSLACNNRGLLLQEHTRLNEALFPIAVASSAARPAPTGPSTCYLILPWGSSFGWGICGKYVSRELSRLTRVRLLSQGVNPQQAANELEYRYCLKQLASQDEIAFLESSNHQYPVLQAILNSRFHPYCGRVTAPYKVGYTFEIVFNEADVQEAARYFDVIAAGSSWCAAQLRAKGCSQAPVVLQGIDPLMFNPSFAEKEMLEDYFVVFSGGKFEYRKGQDLVIRAYKVLQDKYADVMLINCWCNQWPRTIKSMAASRHIHFDCGTGDQVSVLNQMLLDNGLDLDRVLTLPLYPSEMMARIYQNTDVGLFPNRCEPGTNLVLMEYMACGKPVIASYNSGHKDIVDQHNAILIERHHPIPRGDPRQPEAAWDEPDVDETIAHLEWAYQHRAELRMLGEQAGRHLANFTWRQTAEQFYKLLSQGAG
jgi:glycosyltransferase involved in cell wall biosynthesis